MSRVTVRAFSVFFAMLLLGSVLVFASFQSAFAAVSVTVSPEPYSDASKAIQAKLDEAKSRATSSNPYTVTIAKGTYKLSTALHLYSNTKLILTGVTLQRTTANVNVVKIGDNDDTRTGYFYQNISIEGGVLDGKNTAGTVVKMGHGRNLVLKNTVVKNVKNSHLMEAAGIDGLTVTGCSFSNQVLTADNPMPEPEAIQLDILSQRHMRGYRSEDIPLKNVTITRCSFSNVPRGVGSHTAVVNNPVIGVVISDNTFTNMTSAAVHGLNYVNCTISGNRIDNAPRGIVLYSMFEKGVHFGSSLAAEGKTKSSTPNAYKTPLANQNIVIENNVLNIKGKDSYFGYESDGIYLAGLTLTSNLKKGADRDAIKKGSYYMSGATVANNKITTTAHGVRFREVRNSVIEKNTISYVGVKSKTSSMYGIQLTQSSKGNAIAGNTIKNVSHNGIYLNKRSSAKTIKGNIITAPGKYGISVEQSSVSKIIENKISKTGNNSIHLFNGSAVSLLERNVVSSSKSNAINVDQKSKVSKLQSNTIKSPKGNGIFAHNGSTIKKLSGNTVSQAGDKGIAVYSARAKTVVSKNKVAKSKSYGIYVDTKTKKYKVVIQGDKLTGSGKAKLVKIVSGKASVSGSKKA